jgi:hypothetical protein
MAELIWDVNRNASAGSRLTHSEFSIQDWEFCTGSASWFVTAGLTIAERSMVAAA